MPNSSSFRLLQAVDIFSPLLVEEKNAVCEALVAFTYHKNQFICKRGDPALTLFLVYEGTIVVVQNDGQKEFTATVDVPLVFGHQAIAAGTPFARDIIVASPSAKVWCQPLRHRTQNFVASSQRLHLSSA